ncbi:hypothetical protein EST38_g6033 [Candolleomyces aberdarensis]|uniref:Uncharacterized protein n=1 Tax=Candolleomyces aberdarensis TaxID=2316362 RepID=A0A4Q2DIZ5_9AGAR|nr:hypothetical protein EST38_g6033 [Candolleomyces aberdarensis]
MNLFSDMNTSLSYKRVSGNATDEHDAHLEENQRELNTQRHATDDTPCRLSDGQPTECLLSQIQALSNTPNHPDSSVTLGATEHATASLSEVEPATMSSQLPDSCTLPQTPSVRRSKKRKPAYNENSSALSSPSTRSIKRLKVNRSLAAQYRPATGSQEVGSLDDGEEGVESPALRDFDVNSQSGNVTSNVDDRKENTPKGKGKSEERASYPAGKDDRKHFDGSNDIDGEENDITSITAAAGPSSPHGASSRHSSDPEVYLMLNGVLVIDEEYSSPESSQESNPEYPSGGIHRSGGFRQNAKGDMVFISDWQSPPSQPSLSQPGQGDDDDEDEYTEIDYGSSPPDASQ